MQLERLTIQPHPLLPEEGRAFAVQLHHQRKQRDHREGQQQQQPAGGDIEHALGNAGNRPTGGETVRKDQPAGIERIEIDPACLAFQEAGEVIDVHTRRLHSHKVLERQRIAPLFQRQHHFGRAEIGDVARTDRQSPSAWIASATSGELSDMLI